MSRRRWIATAHDHFDAMDAVIVEHEDKAEAARLAALALRNNTDDPSDIETVFLAPWEGHAITTDREAYVVVAAVESAELQCCGGGDHVPLHVSTAPHWATCPEAPRGEKREPDG